MVKLHSYNSYQDFIISNGLVRTKLANTNTNETAGNWQIDIHSKLDITYDLRVDPPWRMEQYLNSYQSSC